jgi:hypothetical protein
MAADAADALGLPLPLLEVERGIITEHILPHLRPAHRAALSLTCKKLRAAVAAGVRELVLPGGRCCPATSYDLAAAFPGVRALTFTPSNLHEAMNVLPTLLMTVRGAAVRARGRGRKGSCVSLPFGERGGAAGCCAAGRHCLHTACMQSACKLTGRSASATTAVGAPALPLPLRARASASAP